MMITDKILIFFTNPIDVNMGGPSGFLAHNLLDKPRDSFVFATSLFNANRFKYSLKNKIFGKANNYEAFIFKEIRADQYKYIFFHDCYTFERCRHLIKDNQVVVLQSHSPELPSEELRELTEDQNIIQFTKRAEENSFKRANYIVFPTEGCIELYKDLDYDRDKIRFILSGCRASKNLRLYPLETTKINILYIGRRNKIKGFDIVLDSFVKVLSKRNDLNLIIAGKGEKVEHKNIFDVGFTNTPLNWINSVDYVVNANRKSYFDLSIIEALSAGARLIMADNYGHQFFKNISKDIITFDVEDPSALINILDSGRLTKKVKPSEINKKLYLENFSDELYYKRLIDFFSKIKSN